MNTYQVKYTPKLSLFAQSLSVGSNAPIITKPTAIDHIVVVDCSGSMTWDLPNLRTQLKNKIATLVGPDDTVSIVWFSSKNEYGIVQENVRVHDANDLARLNTAIDRFLKPVGLTGFKQPLEEVREIMKRIRANKPDAAFNLFFMSDGWDNQWSRTDILKAAADLSGELSNAVFVEYGWNADHELLGKMAEVCGGQLCFSKNFHEYEPTFEASMKKPGSGAKKRVVPLQEKAELGYVFSYDVDGKVVVYGVNDNNGEQEILVPEDLEAVYFFAPNTGGDAFNRTLEEHLVPTYYGLLTLSQKMLGNDAFEVLEALGDVYLAGRFNNCFSKEDHVNFEADLAYQATGEKRYRQGYNPNAVPKSDAFTVLDLMNLLCSSKNNLLYPLDKSFSYERIGGKAEQTDVRTKFTITDPDMGVPLNTIVYHSSRPNASVQVTFQGHVSLPDDHAQFGLPEVIPTHIYRNYTLVRDGIVHSRHIPVALDETTFEAIGKVMNLPRTAVPNARFLLDLSDLPVINRQMVGEITEGKLLAADIFPAAFELERAGAAQKVFKYYRNEAASGATQKGLKDLYGESAATYLAELGIKDYGYSPASKVQPIKDPYTAVALTISVKGLSSLPKVADVEAKMTSGKKLTLGEAIMAEYIEEYQQRPVGTPTETQEWLELRAAQAIAEARKQALALKKTLFVTTVGHVWFTDLPPGEGSMTWQWKGLDVTVSAKIGPVQVD